MTTKEYVSKYKLDVSDKFNHTLFVQDLANDFIALLEINKANDNLKGFDNAVRCVKMKYDAIVNKTRGVFPEKLWNFFWATVVVKLREELCPRDMEKKRQIQEERKKNGREDKLKEDMRKSNSKIISGDVISFLCYLLKKKHLNQLNVLKF